LEAEMTRSGPSSEWDKKTVIERLRAQSKGSKPVAAQVFLAGDKATGNLSELAQELVKAAASKTAGKPKPAAVGRVSDLAKSFSLTAHPDVFAALAKNPAVKSILPSEIEDIYPKPVKVVPE
jgi:hypothetical protein